uniref:Uncharacterized protein n=1 Tax=Anguilla anguilla TaxID=7936 RepID=A0A0E9TH87_ANGAN
MNYPDNDCDLQRYLPVECECGVTAAGVSSCSWSYIGCIFVALTHEPVIAPYLPL